MISFNGHEITHFTSEICFLIATEIIISGSDSKALAEESRQRQTEVWCSAGIRQSFIKATRPDISKARTLDIFPT